jgi:hypothetical protein
LAPPTYERQRCPYRWSGNPNEPTHPPICDKPQEHHHHHHLETKITIMENHGIIEIVLLGIMVVVVASVVEEEDLEVGEIIFQTKIPTTLASHFKVRWSIHPTLLYFHTLQNLYFPLLILLQIVIRQALKKKSIYED